MKIAITGGIGSGKTTICKELESNGYYVYYSDDRFKWLANNNSDLKTEIIKLLGDDSYSNDVYNTKYVRNIIFSDDIILKLFNNIVDKYISLDYYDKIRDLNTLSFFESALIFEHNLFENFDIVIGVYCDPTIVLDRISRRNNITHDMINKIISHQMDVHEKMSRCDIVINNSYDTKPSIIVNDILNKIQKYDK